MKILISFTKTQNRLKPRDHKSIIHNKIFKRQNNLNNKLKKNWMMNKLIQIRKKPIPSIKIKMIPDKKMTQIIPLIKHN